MPSRFVGQAFETLAVNRRRSRRSIRENVRKPPLQSHRLRDRVSVRGFRMATGPPQVESASDPRTGRSGDLYRSVTVVLPSATSADALSTAFCFLPQEDMALILRKVGGGEIRLVTAIGERRTLRI
jgi:hypothetical protein